MANTNTHMFGCGKNDLSTRIIYPLTCSAGLSLAAIVLLTGCLENDAPPPRGATPSDVLALSMAVTNCELRAANKIDDGKEPIAEVAQAVVAGCTAERFRTREAVHLALHDPEMDMDDLKSAVGVVEKERAARR